MRLRKIDHPHHPENDADAQRYQGEVTAEADGVDEELKSVH